MTRVANRQGASETPNPGALAPVPSATPRPSPAVTVPVRPASATGSAELTVLTGPAAWTNGALEATVSAPEAPGHYVVRIDVRDVDGSELPVGQRVSVSAGEIGVYGPYRAAITSPAMPGSVAPGAQVLLELGVRNTGTSAWNGSLAAPAADPLAVLQGAASAPTSLYVSWQQAGGGAPQVAAVVPIPLASGQSSTVSLMLVAPAAPGRYTLAADVVDPRAGSLAATGYPTYRWDVDVTQQAPPAPAAAQDSPAP